MEQNLNQVKISYKVFNRKQIHKNKFGNSWAQLDYSDLMKRQWNELCNMGVASRGIASKEKPNTPIMWEQRLDPNYAPNAQKNRPIKDIVKDVEQETLANLDLPNRLNIKKFSDKISIVVAKKHSAALKASRIAATKPLPLLNPTPEDEKKQIQLR